MLVARFVDVRQVGRTLSTVSLPWFLASLAMVVLDLSILGAKSHFLLHAFGIRVGFWVPLVAYYRGRVFSIVAPSSLGIDAYRCHFLHRHGPPVKTALASIVVERFLGAVSSIAIVAVLLPFLLERLAVPGGFAWAAVSWTGFALIAFGVTFASRRAGRLAKLERIPLLPKKLHGPVVRFLRSLAVIEGETTRVQLFFAASLAEKFVYGSMIFFAARSLGLPVEYLYVASATPVLAFLERIPISVSALGVREGLYVVLLDPYHVDPATAVSVALVVRGCELVFLALNGLAWIASGGRRMLASEVRQMSEEA